MKAQIALTLDSGKKITLSCDEVKELMTLLEAYKAATEPLPMQPWFPRDIWVESAPDISTTTGSLLYTITGTMPIAVC